MKYYKKKGNIYSLYEINTILIIISILFLVYSFKTIISFDYANIELRKDFIELLSPLIICLSVYFLNNSIIKISFNKQQSFLTINKLFNIGNKKYILKKPIRTKVVTNLSNGNIVDYDIYIQTETEMTKFKTFSKFNKSKIDPFIDETLQIIYNE